jgi:predicted RNA-binding protein YlqC (UPF0109 family)
MPKSVSLLGPIEYATPDYSGLVEYLVSPFLEYPDSFSVDWEQANQNRRVWVRLAFESEDKGRVYGRGGRNLQAIRTVLETAAKTAGQTLYLDIYESQVTQQRRTRPRSNFHRPVTTRRKRGSSGGLKFPPKPRF